MIYKFVSITAFLFLSLWARAQKLSAHVFASEDKSELAYCSVSCQAMENDFNSETITDSEGFFELSLPKGTYKISIQHIAYETLIDTISINEVLTYHDFYLKENAISGINPIIKANLIPEVNTLFINKKNFLKLSGSFNDPTRLLLKFPGISSTNDQANFISLKGLPPFMTGWFLNGASIVNPNHLSNTGTFTDQASASGGGVNMISGNSINSFRFTQNPLNNRYFLVGSGLSDFELDIAKGGQFSIGLLGTELSYAYEKNKLKLGASYRYSTLGILSALGVPLGDEKINFQDLHARISREHKSFSWSIDYLRGNSSNIHDPLEETLFLKDALFIELQARQQLVSAKINGTHNRWSFKNTLNYSDRQASRLLQGSVPHINLSLDSLESTTENKLALFNSASFFINNSWALIYTQQISTGLINQQEFEKGYSEIGSLVSVEWEKAKWKIAGSIGGSWIGVGPTFLTSDHNHTNMELRFSTQLKNANNLWNFQASSGATNLLAELYLIDPALAPMKNHNLSLDFLSDQSWGKIKLGAYYHFFNDIIISTEENTSYFSRLDLLKQSLINNRYSQNGTAHIYGSQFQYQFDYKAFQFLQNLALYSVNMSDEIESDYDFGHTYSSSLSYAKKWKSKQLLFSTTFQGRGANKTFEINESLSTEKATTIYNRNARLELKPYSRVDLKITYQWGKLIHNTHRHSMSIDIQNLLNQKNDSYPFYDPLAARIVNGTQLGLIPILSYQLRF